MKKPRRRSVFGKDTESQVVYSIDNFLYYEAMRFYKNGQEIVKLARQMPGPSDSGSIRHINKCLSVIDDLRCRNIPSLKFTETGKDGDK